MEDSDPPPVVETEEVFHDGDIAALNLLVPSGARAAALARLLNPGALDKAIESAVTFRDDGAEAGVDAEAEQVGAVLGRVPRQGGLLPPPLSRPGPRPAHLPARRRAQVAVADRVNQALVVTCQ